MQNLGGDFSKTGLTTVSFLSEFSMFSFPQFCKYSHEMPPALWGIKPNCITGRCFWQSVGGRPGDRYVSLLPWRQWEEKLLTWLLIARPWLTQHCTSMRHYRRLDTAGVRHTCPGCGQGILIPPPERTALYSVFEQWKWNVQNRR